MKRSVSQLDQREESLRQCVFDRLFEGVARQVQVDITTLNRNGCEEPECVCAAIVETVHKLLLGWVPMAMPTGKSRVWVEGNVRTETVHPGCADAVRPIRGL